MVAAGSLAVLPLLLRLRAEALPALARLPGALAQGTFESSEVSSDPMMTLGKGHRNDGNMMANDGSLMANNGKNDGKSWKHDGK